MMQIRISTVVVHVLLLWVMLAGFLKGIDAAVGLSCNVSDTSNCTSGREECITDTCNCTAGYSVNGTACFTEVSLGARCNSSHICIGVYVLCNTSNGLCICSTEAYEYNSICQQKSVLNGSCRNANGCTGDHVVCSSSTGGTCQCDTNYYADQGVCYQKSVLNGSCRNANGCTGDHVVCISPTGGTCQCDTNYYADQGVCYQKSVINGSCHNANGCTGNHVVCSSPTGGTCQCNTNYYEDQGVCYQKSVINGSCHNANGCTGNHVVCSSPTGGTCQCNTNYYEDQGVCYQKSVINGSCHNANGCTGNHVVCSSPTGGTCQCNTNYYEDQGVCYQKSVINGSCHNANGCTGNHVVCSSPTGGTCQCNTNYYEDQGVCYQKSVINGSCHNANGCTGNHVVCSSPTGGTCQCNTNYYEDQGVCYQKSVINGSCHNANGCTGNHVVCSSPTGGTCQCNTNYYEDQGVCYQKSVINGSCHNANGCTGNHVVCSSPTGGTCQCNTNYYEDQGVCYQKSVINGSCRNANGCTGNHVVCSSPTGGTCQCNTNYYEDQGVCYQKSGLNGYCRNAYGCTGINVVCNSTTGGTCQCDKEFYNSKGVCVLSSLLQVKNLFVAKVGETSLEIGWQNPDNVDDVSKYLVTWQHGSSSPNNLDVSKSNTVTLQNLIPGAAYVVTVMSFNSNKSEASNKLQQATKPRRPGPILNSSSDFDLDDGNIKLVWNYNGLISGVSLQFLVKLIDSNSSKVVETQTTTLATVSLVSSSLRNGYLYSVQITTQSEPYVNISEMTRENSDTYTESIKTFPKVPNPPTGVTCSEVRDIYIILTWTPPLIPNGDIKYYVVESYSYRVNQAETLIRSYNTSSKVSRFNVTDLSPGSFYKFKVYTVNEYSQEPNGTWSHFSYCKTNALIPTPPEKLVASNILSRSFSVSWGKPSDVYGELVGYILKITNLDTGICVVEEFTECYTGCNGVFNLTIVQPNCSAVTTYKNASRTDLEQTRTYTGSFNPDTVYKVSVAAVNTDQIGYTADQNVTTLEAAPQKPYDVKVVNITATTATVIWKIDGPRPGKVNYTVESTGESPAERKIYVISGFLIMSYVMTGLEEYWHYNLTVQASTTIGSNQSNIASFKTEMAPAGNVNFSVKEGSGDNMYQTARVSWNLPEIRERNGPIGNFNIQQEAIVNGTFQKIRDINVTKVTNESYTYVHDFQVQPEMIYRFSVSAFNGLPGTVNSMNYPAPAGPPFIPNEQRLEVIPPSKVSGVGQRSFVIEINTDFFMNDTNGKITDKGLICCKDPICSNDNSSTAVTLNLPTYAMARKQGKMKYKLPVPVVNLTSIPSGSGGRRKRESTNVYQYSVGTETCDNKPDTDYCNGPLEPDSSYRIIAFVCTSGGCALSRSYGPFITLAVPKVTDGAIAAAVGGGVGGGLAVIVIAIVVIFIMRKRNKKRKRTRKALDDSNDQSHMENLTKIKRNRPINLANFAEYVADYHKDSNLKFSEEYEDLKTLSPQHAHEAADMEENRLKNRFVNILPFDHSRVRLLPIDDVPGSDYINANYLPGFSKTREYIACQGPIPATIDDHWRLIWEQNVRVIVMLTQYKEENRVKCEPYMPLELKDPKQYGDLVVECLTYSSMNSFEYRTLKLRLGEKERTIKHFHFLSWRDYSANVQFDTMIDFIKKVRSFIQPPDVEGPMIVHCSAGVGRTGTYITIDHVIQHIDKYGPDSTVDIFNFVLKMRENRTTMVQTEQQYIFIHDCIKEYLDRFKTYENQAFSSEEENLYQNTETIELYQNVNFNSTQKTEL